jgi:hypothetical protein
MLPDIQRPLGSLLGILQLNARIRWRTHRDKETKRKPTNPLTWACEGLTYAVLVVKLLTEPLLPAEASASFISGLFCSGPVDPWKLGSAGFIV